MNSFFSLKRFGLLVLKHWADNKKRYILSVLAMIGLLITWFTFITIIEDENMSAEIQDVTYFFPLFIVGSLYASQYFRDLGSRARGVNFLLVPASAFEKFLCSLLYTAFLFFIVFTAVFYLVDSLMVAVYNSLWQTTSTSGRVDVTNVFDTKFFKFPGGTAIYLVLLFFAVQSVFMLGAVYFRKYNFIKTVITAFIVFLVGLSVTFLIYKHYYPVPDQVGHLPNWLGVTVSVVVMYVIAPLFWTVAYKHLKTKQV